MALSEETTAAHAEAEAIEENLAAKTSGDRPISTIVIVVGTGRNTIFCSPSFQVLVIDFGCVVRSDADGGAPLGRKVRAFRGS